MIFVFSAAFATAGEDRILILGEELALKGAGRLWIGTAGPLSARDTGSALRLKGRREGVSEVRFGGDAFIVRVVKPAAARKARALARATASLVGLRAGWDGTVPVVTGRLHDVKSYAALAADPEKSPWEFRADVPQRLRFAFEDFLARQLGPAAPVRPLAYEDGPVSLFNGPAETAARWRESLARRGVRLRREESAVETAPIVRVDIAVAEIRRDRARQLGLSWPQAIEARLLPDGSWTRPELIFGAHAFESGGTGRLLARPNLLCRSGKEAEFVAGGEFPIKIFNYKLQDVIWKRYGIVLRVKPKADLSGRISLAIETEVSSIDASRTVDGIPGLLTNKVASHFDLNRPRTIVLSGLIKSEDSRHREGWPGLSALPILGPLFGSRDWRENRSELVIFVRPTIVREEDP